MLKTYYKFMRVEYFLPFEFEGKQIVFIVDDVNHMTMIFASEYHEKNTRGDRSECFFSVLLFIYVQPTT